MVSKELEEKIIKYVEKHRDDIIDYLVRLIKTKSDNPPGLYEEISKVVADEFKKLGFDEIKTIRVPDEEVKKLGLETPRINVLGIMKGTSGKPVLVFNPHMDTVPPGSGWTVNPYGGEIIDGWIYGRGASDSKGNIVAYTYALAAIREAGVKLRGDAIVACTVDEETGGFLGPKYLLDHGILKPDMAIVEGFAHHIWNALNGCLWMKIIVRGKTAHASMPYLGVDAIRKAVKVLEALYDYQHRLTKRRSNIPGIEFPTIVPTIIHGGVKENVVCDLCEIRFDRRITPNEKPEEVIKEIEDILKGLMLTDPEMKLEWKQLMLAKPAGPVPPNHPLIEAIRHYARKIFNEEISVIGIPGFADSRFYWERNIPFAHYGVGPAKFEDARAHGPDERVLIDDVINATKVLALATVRLLS